MLNDVKIPPTETASKHGDSAKALSHGHARPHTDPNEPGLHHARIMGERTQIDPVYDTSIEDRGSNFSIGLTLTVVVIVTVTMLAILWSVYR